MLHNNIVSLGKLPELEGTWAQQRYLIIKTDCSLFAIYLSALVGNEVVLMGSRG